MKPKPPGAIREAARRRAFPPRPRPGPLPVQLFVGDQAPAPDRVQPVTLAADAGALIMRYTRAVKPLGGLWTAPYDPATGSPFVQLCIREGQIWRAQGAAARRAGQSATAIYAAWCRDPWPWIWAAWQLTPDPAAPAPERI